jgi:hypothetical protein
MFCRVRMSNRTQTNDGDKNILEKFGLFSITEDRQPTSCTHKFIHSIAGNYIVGVYIQSPVFINTPQYSPPPPSNICIIHRLNIELDLLSLFGLHVHSCTHWLKPRKTPPPPHLIWAHLRGRYWSAKIDDISL